MCVCVCVGEREREREREREGARVRMYVCVCVSWMKWKMASPTLFCFSQAAAATLSRASKYAVKDEIQEEDEEAHEKRRLDRGKKKERCRFVGSVRTYAGQMFVVAFRFHRTHIQ